MHQIYADNKTLHIHAIKGNLLVRKQNKLSMLCQKISKIHRFTKKSSKVTRTPLAQHTQNNQHMEWLVVVIQIL